MKETLSKPPFAINPSQIKNDWKSCSAANGIASVHRREFKFQGSFVGFCIFYNSYMQRGKKVKEVRHLPTYAWAETFFTQLEKYSFS